MMEPTHITGLEEELRKMNSLELLQYEDNLLLENELSTEFRIRQSEGRFILVVLTGAFWVLFLFFVKLLNGQIGENSRTLLFPILYLGSLFAAVLASHFAWKFIGLWPRTILRMTLHYWPVVLYGIILLTLWTH